MPEMRETHPNQILLGVDGSPDCMAGIELIQRLPCLGESSIKVVSVWSGRAGADQARARAALEQARGLLAGQCARVSAELCQGHPAEELVRAAEGIQADLIGMGARGMRSGLDFLLGGVAQQVAEHATCPVLLARSPFKGLGKVLLAVDGSPCSQNAVMYLAGFRLPEGAEVEVLSVGPAGGLPNVGLNAWPVGHELVPVISDRELEELETLRKAEKESLREQMDLAAARLQEAGKQASASLVEGDAASELMKRARLMPADMVVAGSRGLSAVRSWLMGSVSRKLVQYSPCAVLIVKGGQWCAGRGE